MWHKKVRIALCVGMLTWALPSNASLESGIEAANAGQFEVALKEFRYLADMGYGPGIYELAKMYQGGHGVPKNLRKAAQLFQDAINTGVADAMFSLAVMHEQGQGVKQDKQKAVELYTRAAKKNLAAAQFNLGVMYTNGDGVIKDYYTAMDWYEKAAASNYTLAQFNMALMYYQGLGVTKNIEKSYIWNSIAEYNGNQAASKSRALDEKHLSPSQIERATERATAIYYKIQAREYIPEIRPRTAVF
ncbi:Secretory immunoglobulin A-binding protein EsiB [Pseudoalteromonas holothuriae]|uniref:Secretory immunoglobulin A-binding protein EsiB n=1 Tax=Pseudoalteromonas holothuriae TaxID=2963714 RepID=A0ABN8UG00_9GAMM|nr:tetratricopeptide repeat protein [Pseudoalteromonas sp. CIP111951]CAH9050687.1 Secretory immunoglobulin A-binding protein EsiB [Pseudoalteromonas sp. CIP111951]